MTEGPRLDPRTMFDDVLASMPPHLQRQRQQLDQELAAAAGPAIAGDT
jgi:hypothetical protein